jgi:alpha-glucosidase
MIDLVISHTSDQHPWFTESRSGRHNKRADWYVWADAKPDGTPPNNWLSIFGGSAWEWETTRCQYYMHNFLASQPDLNFHNREVQDALLDVARFWLELGVDGFRLDTINFYFHSQSLQDNPALPPEQRNASTAPEVNPYNFQDHIFDKSQPENIGFLKRFRAVLDEFPAASSVGEVGDSQRGLQIMADYTSGGDRVHMCYSFDFLSPDRLDPGRVRHTLDAIRAIAPDSWSCWAFSNHDVMRHATRWAGHEADPLPYLKLCAALLLTLRGSVCLYQGEELGLPEADVAFHDLQDPYGIRFWPKFKGRDGCRTPMVWSSNLHHGGFSEARPWLPVPDVHRAMAANVQEGRAGSLLEFYRTMLTFRKTRPALVKGDIEFLDAPDTVLAFIRRSEDEALLCVFNMGGAGAVYPLGDRKVAAVEGLGIDGKLVGTDIELGSYAAFVGKLIG